MKIQNCKKCNKDFTAKNTQSFCSRSCAGKVRQTGKKMLSQTRDALLKAITGNKFTLGKKHSPETKEKMRLIHLGNTHNLGRKHSVETKMKLSQIVKGRKYPIESIQQRSGENHYLWIEDRTKLKKSDTRNDSAYFEWRKNVWLRDNFKCKIANPDCEGKIEAHHILGWSEYVELRYEINNGITLCHAHHPRKRAEEKRLIPTFQELVTVSN